MARVTFLFFVLCTFVATTPSVTAKNIHIPGVTQVINTGLTVVAKLLRDAITISKPVSPKVYAALDQILMDLGEAVEDLDGSAGSIERLIKTLTKIVNDAIVTVSDLIKDDVVEANAVLHGTLVSLLGALKSLSSGLNLLP